MLGFPMRNGAAVSHLPIRYIFIPIHILFATLLLWGLFNDRFGQCPTSVYPMIFRYQYGLFYTVYFGFLVLHKYDYMLEWHPNIKDIDYNDVSKVRAIDGDKDRERLRVRMIFVE